jgi:hypothetical protein
MYITADAFNISGIANIPAYSHQHQDSFGSTNAAHFGAIIGGNSPVNTRYYNHSPIAQPFPASYNNSNTMYRQPTTRTIASDISSLSSGFGDGDIIVSDTLVTPPPQAAVSPSSSSNNPYLGRHFSWMSLGQHQPPPGSDSGRETVCTETSEDRPARFRSVTSWVDQQTGRIRRVQQQQQQQQRGEGGEGEGEQAVPPVLRLQIPGNPGIPGIHNPPGEQSFGMMMRGGEEEVPRRVEVGGVGGRVG